MLDEVALLQRDPCRGLDESPAARRAAVGRAHPRRGDALGRAAARCRQAADPRRPARRAGDVPGPRRRRRRSWPSDVLGRLRSSARAARLRRRADRCTTSTRASSSTSARSTAARSGATCARPALQRRHHDLHRRRPPRDARRATPSPAIEAHLEVAHELLAAAARGRGRPPPLVRGDELIREAGVARRPAARHDPRPARGGPLRRRDRHPRGRARPRAGARRDRVRPPEDAPELARIINAAYDAGEAGIWQRRLDSGSTPRARRGADRRRRDRRRARRRQRRHRLRARSAARRRDRRARACCPSTPSAFGTGAGRALLDVRRAASRHDVHAARAAGPARRPAPQKVRLHEWYSRLGLRADLAGGSSTSRCSPAPPTCGPTARACAPRRRPERRRGRTRRRRTTTR